ncbi:hypothetical protein E2553_00120 [Paraburkholderia dipogonis]|uniref:ArsR family transcriptional regulator n=1 Tax=Paraburkholderia dipogonis TaxID=1211383 RepID=A0A4Y8N166_9BURK|nr:hypothetical protein [Paraburkholderia dipogonis]TFE43576.1 hypothetical protein E2553_00120 [Paraburkholderia dipogonis]
MAEEILKTLVLDDSWTMDLRSLVARFDGKSTEGEVRYHAHLLEDIGLVEIRQNGYIRVTSSGQDRAENRDTKDPMATWASLAG